MWPLHSEESVAKEGDTSATPGQTVDRWRASQVLQWEGPPTTSWECCTPFSPKVWNNLVRHALCFSLPPVFIRFLIYYRYILSSPKRKDWVVIFLIFPWLPVSSLIADKMSAVFDSHRFYGLACCGSQARCAPEAEMFSSKNESDVCRT